MAQAPPGAQQLSLPDFFFLPHLGHAGTIVVIGAAVPGIVMVALAVLVILVRVGVSVHIWALVNGAQCQGYLW